MPALDSYFAITANLGTHTFFMIGLPICFWCGWAAAGKAYVNNNKLPYQCCETNNVYRLVHMLALGVFWTGFIKDFYSLPRPLSPPLHRITMSGSAALEYGFPSTHSANAVSVALYALLSLRSAESAMGPTARIILETLSYFYAASIVLGRLYCGMHGFLDVIVGSAMGAGIAALEFYHGPQLDTYMHSCSWLAPLIGGLIVVALVRIHPEPADDCPCFDDSVAFAGVVIGVEFGTWSYGKISGDPWETNAHGDGVINVGALGVPINVARIILGVLIIFAWRETMKPLLLKYLPYLFRFIEHLGLSLPRRFFTPATEYKSVPPGSRLDTLFPKASDFPRIVEGIRHPTTRGRSVSIGPQSAADVYEALAYRERKRRESIGSNKSFNEENQSGKSALATGTQAAGRGLSPGGTHEMTKTELLTADVTDISPQDAAIEEKQFFAMITKPRVRYDIEVVTKLIVYAGMPILHFLLIPWMY